MDSKTRTTLEEIQLELDKARGAAELLAFASSAGSQEIIPNTTLWRVASIICGTMKKVDEQLEAAMRDNAKPEGG